MEILAFAPSMETGSLKRLVLTLTWLLFSLSFFFVLLRLYARWRRGTKYGADDLCIVVSLVLNAAATSLWTVSVAHNGASHSIDLRPEQFLFVLKIAWISQAFCCMSGACGEISISFFVLRLLGPINLWKKRALWFIIIFTFVVTSISVILMFTQCKPIEALWMETPMPGAKCWRGEVYMDWAIFTNGYMTAVAVVLSLLPIAVIQKLQIKPKEKVMLIGVMALGLLAAICAAIKTAWFAGPGKQARGDPTTSVMNLIIWSSLVNNVIIIAACIPPLRSFIHRPISHRVNTLVNSVRQSRGFKKVLSPCNSSKRIDRVHVYSPSPALRGSSHNRMPSDQILITTELKQQSNLHVDDLDDWPLSNNAIDDVEGAMPINLGK